MQLKAQRLLYKVPTKDPAKYDSVPAHQGGWPMRHNFSRKGSGTYMEHLPCLNLESANQACEPNPAYHLLTVQHMS